MEPKSNFNVVGGITAVVLYPTSASLPDEPTTTIDEDSEGVVVAVDCGASSYTESVTSDGSFSTPNNFLVHHRLELQTLAGEEPLCDPLSQTSFKEGVVLDVTLASGATIRIGYSERHGGDYPARLTSSKFDSGDNALAYPLRTMVFESTDQVVLV